jgi:hypothetical protein
MTIHLISGVYQDGDTFYHEEFGALVSFPGTVQNDRDIEGARTARRMLAEQFPDLAYLESR